MAHVLAVALSTEIPGIDAIDDSDVNCHIEVNRLFVEATAVEMEEKVNVSNDLEVWTAMNIPANRGASSSTEPSTVGAGVASVSAVPTAVQVFQATARQPSTLATLLGISGLVIDWPSLHGERCLWPVFNRSWSRLPLVIRRGRCGEPHWVDKVSS